MKRLSNHFLVAILLLIPGYSRAGLFEFIRGVKPEDQAQIFIHGGVEEKRHQLKTLETELAQGQEREKEESAALQEQLDNVNKQTKQTKVRIAHLKDQVEVAAEQEKEFLNKQLTNLNQQYQTLIDLQLSHKQRLNIIEEHIGILKTYLKDPSFKAVHIEKRAFYTFDDLQRINRKVADTEEDLRQLQEQRNNAQMELDNRKRDLQVAQQVSKAKQQEQEAFGAKRTDLSDLALKHQGELLNLEEHLLAMQQQLYEVQIKELQSNKSFLETTIFIQESHVNILKDDLVRLVKPSVRVDNSDVVAAQEEFTKKEQQTAEITKTYYQQVKNWTAERDRLKGEQEALLKKYNITDEKNKTYGQWDTKPDSIQSWLSFAEVGYLYTRISMFNQQIAFRKAQTALEHEQLRAAGTLVKIIKSWNNITLRKFTTDEEIGQEKKRYEASRADLQRERTVYYDKRNTTTSILNTQSKALARLRERTGELKAQRSTVFKHDIKSFTRTLNLLSDAEKMLALQVERNGRLIDVYSTLSSVADNSLKQINSIIGELETIGIWQRSIHAISRAGIMNIVPDIETFLVELRGLIITYVQQWNVGYIANLFKGFISNPLGVVLAIIVLVLAIALMFALHTHLPILRDRLVAVSSEQKAIYLLSSVGAFFVGFFNNYFIWILTWIALFVLVRLEYVSLAFRVLFYLGSIPYLIYLARRSIQYFKKFNEQHEYVFLSEQFQKRLIRVLSIFAYSTISILLFREAFMLASYHQSELPTILLALYSIIFRTLLIFLIGKEEIMSVSPTTTPFWSWLSKLVDRYYYVILIGIVALMVISDPYIGGYGNLVSYFLWGAVLTAILIRILLWVHSYIKQLLAMLFFDTSGDAPRDRFYNAKTWYGIFIILLFMLFVVLGVVLGSRIWGTPISFEDIRNIFTHKLFTVGVGDDKKAITVASFFEIIMFVVGGFVTAVILNRFVLRKIFDLLLIESGVQNIVSIITRYLIMITAIVISFQKVGLSSLLISIGVLIAGIGWIITEPIKDFASYFIILIQRPIKIGDFIKFEDGQMGIVRKITPRSTILRAKNSYSIVVPNSQIIMQKIDNWNYTRNFVAIDDILLVVPYWVEPKHVKEVILGVLERHPDILKNPPPVIRLQNFVPHGYQFMVRGFLSSVNTLNKWDIASDIRFDIIQALQKEGIKLATPFTAIKMVPESFNPLSGSSPASYGKGPSDESEGQSE